MGGDELSVQVKQYGVLWPVPPTALFPGSSEDIKLSVHGFLRNSHEELLLLSRSLTDSQRTAERCRQQLQNMDQN